MDEMWYRRGPTAPMDEGRHRYIPTLVHLPHHANSLPKTRQTRDKPTPMPVSTCSRGGLRVLANGDDEHQDQGPMMMATDVPTPMPMSTCS